MPRYAREHAGAAGSQASTGAAAASSSARPAAAASASSSRRSHAAEMLEESRQTPLGECFSQKQLPFLWACATGNTAEVKKLLSEEQVEQQSAALRRIQCETRGQPVKESTTVEETFLQQVDSCGWTALHWAAAFGRVDILQLLYDSFVDSLPETSHDTSIHLLQESTAQYLSPLYLFMNRTTAYQDTALHVAAHNCHVKTMDWLVHHGADVRLRNAEGNSGQLGQTALMCIVEKKIQKSCSERQEAACRWMLKHLREKEDKEWIDENGSVNDEDEGFSLQVTKQLQAATSDEMNPLGCLRDVMVYGRVRESEATSESNLSSASSAAAVATLKAERKEDIHLTASVNASADTTIAATSSFAVSAGTPSDKLRTEIVKMEIEGEEMVKEDEPAVEAVKAAHKDDLGTLHALSHASASSELFPRRLFPLLSSINFTRSSGSTALMIAAFGGNYAAVLALLENGALVNQDVYDVRGRPVADSALLNAIEECHLDITRLLLEWGANRFVKNGHGETPALLVCSSDQDAFRHSESLRLEFLQCLFTEGLDAQSREVVKKYYLERKDNFGATPFVWSVRRGCPSLTRYLLDLGCDPSVKDPSSTRQWTMMKQWAKKIGKGRTVNGGAMAPTAGGGISGSKKPTGQRSSKHPDHIQLCRMMQLLLTHPRCAEEAEGVAQDLKDHVSETVEAADQALVSAAAEKKTTEARKRARPTTSAPLVPGSAAKKAKTDVSGKGGKASSVPAASKASRPTNLRKPPAKTTVSSAKYSSPSKAASKLQIPARGPASPASPAPPRFFKNGRQHSTEDARLQRQMNKQTDSLSRKEEEKNNTEEKNEEEDVDMLERYDGEQKESDPLDLSASCTSGGTNISPTRIQGTIGARIQKKQDEAATTADTTSLTEPTASPSLSDSLNGDLNFTSAIDDQMLDVEHPTMDQHQPNHEQLSDDQHVFASSSNALKHAEDGDHYQLHMPSSPLKFSNSSSSSVYSKRRSPMMHHDSHLAVPAPSISLGTFRPGRDFADPHHEVPSDELTQRLGAGGLVREGSENSDGISGLGGGRGARAQQQEEDKFVETRKRLEEMDLHDYIAAFLKDKVFLSEWNFLIAPENELDLKSLIPHMGPRSRFRAWVTKNCAGSA